MAVISEGVAAPCTAWSSNSDYSDRDVVLGEYFGALIFSGPSTETAPVNLADFVGVEAFEGLGAPLAAGSLLLIVPILVGVVVLQRGAEPLRF